MSVPEDVIPAEEEGTFRGLGPKPSMKTLATSLFPKLQLSNAESPGLVQHRCQGVIKITLTLRVSAGCKPVCGVCQDVAVASFL